jgi:uncharacterized protein (TIGR03437 family)
MLTLKGAGQCLVTATQPGNSVYAFAAPVSQFFTVAKATLTVSADPKMIMYGAALPALAVSITGFVNGDTAGVVSGSAALTTNATTTNGNPNAGSWTVTPAAGTLVAANYSFSGFNAGTLTVNKAALTVSADSKTITYGAALPALTASITGLVNGDTAGVVSGAAALTTNATTTNANQNAGSWTITPAAGTLTAANYSFSGFNTGTLTVNKATLTASANNATKIYGAPLPVFTAAITGFVNGDNAAVVTGAAGLNTTATASSPMGSYPITAATGTLGAANYTFTFVNGTLSIGKAGTATSLVGGNGPLIATVTVLPPGAGSPTGTVQFLNGTAVFGTAALTGPTATISAPPGSYTAVYSGDGNFSPSTSNVASIFPPAASSVTLSSSANPSKIGQSVTFTAAIVTSGGPPTAGAPGGTVQFLDGVRLLGSSAVFGGQASFTTSALTAGSHNIVAQYGGDSNWPSAQGSYAQDVFAPVTITLTASPEAPVYGQAVVLTASVAATVPAGFAAPTGQITFTVPGSGLFAPPKVLGTATLASGVASLSVNTLAVGSQKVTAGYNGDSTWSVGAATATVTVAQAPTNAAVALTMVGDQLTLTGTVTPVAPGAGTLTGAIQFLDQSLHAVVANANLVGGKGTVTIPANAASTVAGRPVSAVYSGDGNFQGSTSAPLPAVMSATANRPEGFAAEEIVSLFGIAGLNGDTPATLPLTTSLGGVTVKITDRGGTSREALLYGVFASAGQINLMVPSSTSAGLAAVTIELPGGGTMATMIAIAGIAPGVFTTAMTGQGFFAGQILCMHGDGSQTTVNSPSPVSLGAPGDQVFLVLYGTGIRNAGSLTATVNGVTVPVTYFGAQGSYAGLDQVNLGPLPPGLAGSGVVNLVISADGQAANPVTVMIQ